MTRFSDTTGMTKANYTTGASMAEEWRKLLFQDKQPNRRRSLGYSDLPKGLLVSARIKYLCEIGDLLDDEQYNIAMDRIWQMFEMREDWRPE